jgi:RHS repeat-associated protein
MSVMGSRSRRRLAAIVVAVLATTVIGQLPPASVAEAAVVPFDKPADVKGIRVKPVPATPRPAWTAEKREVSEVDLPPEPDLPEEPETVNLSPAGPAALSTGKRSIKSRHGAKAGVLPVYISSSPSATGGHPAVAARSAAVPVDKVRVQLLDREHSAEQGVDGYVLNLSRADGVTSLGQAHVTLDYRPFANSLGGDWSSRLQVVRLSDGRPVPSTNDHKAGTLSASVSLTAAGAITSFGIVAAAAGDNGDYKATTLSPASTWQVSQQTGGFSWSYPIKVPDPVGGIAPDLALSYSSASIDGRTSGNNTQGSWIGDGWDMWPGYIERSYRACDDDKDTQEKEKPNNKDAIGGDLCYFTDNATMSFNGSSSELVKVASTDAGKGDDNIEYRGVTDDGSKVELIRGTQINGDVDNSHWRVTSVDGTQYHFGKNKGEGGSSAATNTDSVWTVPVFSNHPDDPGYDEKFADSRHTRAWRWNLDYVVDPRGNTVTYFYDKEPGAYAREGDEDKRTTYDRGGALLRAEYGSRNDAASTVRPAARVLFDLKNRCIGTCITAEKKPIPRRFPDTPWELRCVKAPCKTQFSPTFWVQTRLAEIRTQVYAGSGDAYTDVDSWKLDQTYLMAGGNESRPMWMKSISHTGHVTTAGGPAVKDPPVVFDPTVDYMPNRVDGPDDGHSSLFRNRIAAITTESGAQIGIGYSDRECTRKALPDPWSNTKRCYPQYYGAEGQKPKLDWFHKYVVNRVDVYDNTGASPQQQTNYDYLDTPAWAYDDSELVKPKKRTWGQFRGYGHVRVRTGLESGVQSRTEYRYFRGMDGDKQPKDKELPPKGTPRDIVVVDSLGGKVADNEAYTGMLREETTFNGPNPTDWISGVLHTPVIQGPTATFGALKAWKKNIGTVRRRTKMSDGTTRWTKTTTTFNADNLAQQVDDFGDETTATDDRCVRNYYARNTATWMLDRVNRSETVGVNCDATVVRPRDVLSDTRTYYDDPKSFGTPPTEGLAVRNEQLDSWNGSEPRYVSTSVTVYDAVGRITSQSDALKRATTTTYTPKITGPVTETTVTTAPKEGEKVGFATTETFEPALGVPVKTVDENNVVSEMAYDGAGRLTAVWAPGRDRAKFPDDPSVGFTYQLHNDQPSAVTTKTLTPGGLYRTSVTLSDGLLRARQTQTQTVSGGRAVTETMHDSRGLVAWTSNPYYDVDGTAPNTTLVSPNARPEIPALTQTTYDGAGRPIEETLMVNGDPQWATITKHAGEKTSVTPPAGGTATTTITDARGQKIEYRQYKDPAKVGSDDATTFDKTAYSYTKRDELATVVGLGGNTWTYEYDLRGQKVVEKDPDRGITKSEYDAVGKLKSTKDARERVLAFTYDHLGRKTSVRKNTDTGPILSEWEYDTLPNGKGKMTKSVRHEYDAAGAASTYTNAVTGYDSASRPTGTTVSVPASDAGLCVSGTLTPCSYTDSITYRPNGAVNDIKIPAVAGLPKETLSPSYNKIGLSSGLLGLIPGGNNQIYVQEVEYNQLDQLIGKSLGENGTRIGLTYGIDEPTGRLTTFTSLAEMKPDIHSYTYKYDDAGSLIEIHDSPDAQPGQEETQCFRHDHQRRLTTAWTPASRACAANPVKTALGGPAAYWRSYTFDAYGNRKTERVHAGTDTTSTYSFPASGGAAGTKPHAVTQVTNTGGSTTTQQYGYDRAGNTVCRPATTVSNTCPTVTQTGKDSQTLDWDDEGHLARSTDKTGDTTFVYDADGNRLMRRDPTGATLYLPNGTEIRKPKNGPATGTRYYSYAGSAIAVRTPAPVASDGVVWMVTDHHNTGSAAITNDGNLTVTRRRTLPFGEVRGIKPAIWAGDKGFVGGTQDNNGLIHLGAREYDPAIGRFISVDPIMDLSEPKQWDGYSYANNTPASLSDPSGLDPCRVGGQGCTDPDGDGVFAPPGSGEGEDKGGPTDHESFWTGTGDDGKPMPGPGQMTTNYAAKYAGFFRQPAPPLPLWDPNERRILINRTFCYNNPDECAKMAKADNARALQNMKEFTGIADVQRCATGGENRISSCAWAAANFLPGAIGIFGRAGRVSRVGKACSSFSGETKVLLSDGTSKEISDVEVGKDEVLATDPETGEQTPRRVTHVWVHDDTLIGLGINDDVLITTEDHPFWDVIDQRWERADHLDPQDELLTPDSSRALVTGLIARSAQVGRAYNLTVADIHTYYVIAGDTPVLVHNCGGLVQGHPSTCACAAGGLPQVRNGALAGNAHPVTGIPFDMQGFPDFSSVRHPSVPDVRIALSGNRSTDFARANRAAGLDSTPTGYTWHHHQDKGLMQLIDRTVHAKTGHTGGFR